MFDCYFTNDERVAKEYFHLKENPDMMPFVMVLDPKKNLALKKQKNPNDPLKVKQEHPLETGSYMFKTTQMIFPTDVTTEL